MLSTSLSDFRIIIVLALQLNQIEYYARRARHRVFVFPVFETITSRLVFVERVKYLEVHVIRKNYTRFASVIAIVAI